MNKLLPALILAVLTLGTSQAESDRHWANNHYEWVAQTATQGARVRVTITKQKPKLYLARIQRPIIQLLLEDDDSDYYDELPEFQVGYRRPELVNQTADIDLTDEIKLRLVLARKKALAKYHEKWG